MRSPPWASGRCAIRSCGSGSRRTGCGRADWRWCDAALGRLRELGIEPIVGLVHHGSGPRSTHLLDPGFAPGLADYAAAFAERYPWVRRYTPVNEPLTTARFCRPLRALVSASARRRRVRRGAAESVPRHRATRCAAIRERVPDAQLVQTEDAGVDPRRRTGWRHRRRSRMSADG